MGDKTPAFGILNILGGRISSMKSQGGVGKRIEEQVLLLSNDFLRVVVVPRVAVKDDPFPKRYRAPVVLCCPWVNE